MSALGPLLATATITSAATGADSELTGITWALSPDFDGGMPAQGTATRLTMPFLPLAPDTGSNVAAAVRDATLGVWAVARVSTGEQAPAPTTREVCRVFMPWGPGGLVGIPATGSPGFGAADIFTGPTGPALQVQWWGSVTSAEGQIRVANPGGAASVPAGLTIEVRLAVAANSAGQPASSVGADVAQSGNLLLPVTVGQLKIQTSWANRQPSNYPQPAGSPHDFHTPPVPPVAGTIGLWIRAFKGDTEVSRALMPWGPSAVAGDAEGAGAAARTGAVLLHYPAPVLVRWQVDAAGVYLDVWLVGAVLGASNCNVRITHAHIGTSAAVGPAIARSIPGGTHWNLTAPLTLPYTTAAGASVNLPFIPRRTGLVGVWAVLTQGAAELARQFLPWGPGLMDEPPQSRAADEARYGLQVAFRAIPGHPGVVALVNWRPAAVAGAGGALPADLAYIGRDPGGLYVTLREAASGGADVPEGADPGAPTLVPTPAGDLLRVTAPPQLPLAAFALALDSPDQVRLESRYTGQITVLDRTAPIWRGSAQWKAQTLRDARLLADFAARLSGQRHLVRLELPPDLYGPRGTGVAPGLGAATRMMDVTVHLGQTPYLEVNGNMDYTPAPRDMVTVNGRLYILADVRTGASRFKRLSCLPAALPPPFTGSADDWPIEFARPYLLARATGAEPVAEASDGFQVELAGFEFTEVPQADSG